MDGAGAIIFQNTINRAKTLTINNTIRTEFDGNVGSNTPLTSINLADNSIINFNGNGNPSFSISTSGDQFSGGPVTLNVADPASQGISLTSQTGNITFASTATSQSDLIIPYLPLRSTINDGEQ